MPYTLQATLGIMLDVVEIADSAVSPNSGQSGNRRTYDQVSNTVNLNSQASYPEIGGQVVDLSGELGGGGTLDFDFTACPWAGDVSIDIDKSTKKLVALIVRMSEENDPAGVTLGPQGGNGYAPWGASKTKTLYPGAHEILFYADPTQNAELILYTPTVGAGAKDFRFAGATGDSWKCLAIFNG